MNTASTNNEFLKYGFLKFQKGIASGINRSNSALASGAFKIFWINFDDSKTPRS
ncbi:hypothetical protein D3C86_1350430 [compost metagenome]